MVKLESPLYARIALKAIHDPDALGTRVVMEITGALTGVVMGWQWFSRAWREGVVRREEKTRGLNTDLTPASRCDTTCT